ncbi:MAG: hypothetical protein ACRD1X_08170 [Vicinamibacteria bacterium]
MTAALSESAVEQAALTRLEGTSSPVLQGVKVARGTSGIRRLVEAGG